MVLPCTNGLPLHAENVTPGWFELMITSNPPKLFKSNGEKYKQHQKSISVQSESEKNPKTLNLIALWTMIAEHSLFTYVAITSNIILPVLVEPQAYKYTKVV